MGTKPLLSANQFELPIGRNKQVHVFWETQQEQVDSPEDEQLVETLEQVTEALQ